MQAKQQSLSSYTKTIAFSPNLHHMRRRSWTSLFSDTLVQAEHSFPGTVQPNLQPNAWTNHKGDADSAIHSKSSRALLLLQVSYRSNTLYPCLGARRCFFGKEAVLRHGRWKLPCPCSAHCVVYVRWDDKTMCWNFMLLNVCNLLTMIRSSKLFRFKFLKKCILSNADYWHPRKSLLRLAVQNLQNSWNMSTKYVQICENRKKQRSFRAYQHVISDGRDP